MTKWISSRNANLIEHLKPINVIQNIDKVKDKNHMIILKDIKRASENIQHPFMIQTLSKLEIEENFLSLNKNLNGQP